MVIAMRRPTL